jgi:CPA2 family monovalent cation:H+ antiporter-2
MATDFIQGFAIVLLFAIGVTLIFYRIKQPVVFGYLVAGILIGPYTLKLVPDLDAINLFAELGIIVLMYSMGLKFNLKKLRKIGAVAVALGTLEILMFLAIGNTVGEMLGWSHLESIFLGSVLAFSSTAVILKFLMDRGGLRKEYSLLILGILLVEDVGAIALIAILGSVSVVGVDLLLDTTTVVFRILVFFSIALAFGLKFIPPFINRVRKTGSDEMLLLTSLGLCFALAAFSDYLGFSVALGAFMMGAIISESRYQKELENLTDPIRDVFASMFFISIGMLVDPFAFDDFLFEIAIISTLAVIGKLIVISPGLYLSGYTGLTSLRTGLGLIPRGEFSFIIAKLGVDQGVVGPDFYLITIAVVMVTTFVGPASFGSSGRLVNFMEGNAPVQVRSFFKFLRNWLETLGRQFRLDSAAATELQKIARDIGINALIIIIIYEAVLVARHYAFETLATIGRAFFAYAGLAPPSWFSPVSVVMIIGIILSLPSFYIVIRNIRRLIDLSIDMASSVFGFLGVDLFNKALRNAAYAATAIVFTITLLPIIISEAVGHGMVLNFSVLLIILLSGYFFWRAIGEFHDSLHEMITETLLAEEIAGPEGVDSIIESLKVDRDFALEKIDIMKGSAAIGKTLAETDIRNLTGATIVAIERGHRTIRNPGPMEPIKQGDVLLLIGTEEERESAEKLLLVVEKPKREEAFGLEKIKIKKGSSAVEKTLAGTELRALTGVTIIAIEREGETIRNPRPQNLIKEGDVLLLIGTTEEIKNARKHL